MSGCPSDRSVHVPVGTLSLTLTGLAVAGIAVLASQVAGVPSGDAPPSGSIIASTAAIEPGSSSMGGIASGGVQFSSGFEDTPADSNCMDAPFNGNGYIGGGGSGAPQNCTWHASTSAQPGYIQPHIDASLPNTDLQHLRFQRRTSARYPCRSARGCTGGECRRRHRERGDSALVGRQSGGN